MKQLIKRIRRQPRPVRERITLLTTVGIVVLVIIITLVAKSTLEHRAPNERDDSAQSVQPFQLIKQTLTGENRSEQSSESNQ